MTANTHSSVTIVGDDGVRDGELAKQLSSLFEVDLQPLCRETFDAMAGKATDILLVFDNADPDLIEWIDGLYSQQALPIVFFSSTDDRSRIHDAISACVSSYIYDGYRPERVPAIIDTVIARYDQRRSLEEELASAKQDLDDRKVIDRAKGLIMTQRGCTEDEAYSSLRKQAMDSNRKIADFAKDVLMVSEVLKVK